jgi:hypothetical protein
MAIDPAPVKINLREPGKLGLLHPALAVSEPSAVAQMPPRVAQLELETQMLSEQICALNADL